MATTRKYNFDWLCRTCMQELVEVSSFDANPEPQQQWQSIINPIKECGSLPIKELISNTIKHVEVQLSDELPKKICRECMLSLVNAYRFQQTCLKSQQKLDALVARRQANLLIPIEASLEEGNKIKKSLKEEPLPEAKNDETEFEYVNATTESPTPEIATKEEISLNEFSSQDHYKTSQDVLSEFVKNEQCDDDDGGNTEHDKNKSTNTVNTKVLIIETEEEKVSLDKPPFTCKLCNKSFKKLYHLNAHVKRHKQRDKPIQMREIIKQDAYNEPSAECSDIVANEPGHNDDSNDDDDLKMHSKDIVNNKVLMEETAEKQISEGSSTINCHLCCKTFTKKRCLKIHLNWHRRINFEEPIHDEKLNKSTIPEHVCDLCKQCFCSEFSLRRHKRLKHPGNKPTKKINTLPCGMCHKTFSDHFKLSRHKQSQHSREKELRKSKANLKTTKPIVCEICKKILKNRDRLKSHLKSVHTNARPYECDKCGKAFKLKGALSQHILSHSVEKPFECPHCPMRFKSVAHVSKHVLVIHSEFKRFICDICAYSSGTSHQLKIHKMGHSGEKPHKCELCEKRFVRLEAVRRHMRTHTGEKPYKCKYCDRAYAQSNDHMKHLRTHLGDNVYRCELCPLAFPLALEMRLHFATHKNEDSETRERNLKALKEEEAKLLLKLVGKDT